MEEKIVQTEKGAPSLATTGDARVNLFFKIVRGLQKDLLESLLEASWKEDALDTLRIIFQSRDCRGGKGEKAIFSLSLQWLAKNHPETLLKNLKMVPFFGTWKDLFALMGTSFESAALDVFADQLRRDLSVLEEISLPKKEQEGEPMEIETKGISLCAKWAPTEGHTHDVKTKAARKLAKKLFPKAKRPLKEYRKLCLVPLRNHLKVTEVFMCKGKWDQINYQGVPSRCMNLERKAFAKHDQQRFQKFLQNVKTGKSTIKGKQMFPHELCKHYFKKNVVDDVVELQWNVIIEGVKSNGFFQNALVLSDVSGSMEGTPMEVSIALGLVISEVTAPPFHNVIITFHESPTFHEVKGTSLMEKVRDVKAMPWGGNTNFQAVFDLILGRAKEAKVPDSAMPKTLFVLSDMQFDAADGGGKTKTNFENVKMKYAEAGYTMPQIIFWNLRANTQDFPVGSNEQGVGLVSGFSPSLLKLLLETGELTADVAVQAVKEDKKEPPKIDPYVLLRKALDDERYAGLTL